MSSTTVVKTMDSIRCLPLSDPEQRQGVSHLPLLDQVADGINIGTDVVGRNVPYFNCQVVSCLTPGSPLPSFNDV
jgi:hypothetical protein